MPQTSAVLVQSASGTVGFMTSWGKLHALAVIGCSRICGLTPTDAGQSIEADCYLAVDGKSFCLNGSEGAILQSGRLLSTRSGRSKVHSGLCSA